MGFNVASSRSNQNKAAIVEQLEGERAEAPTHEGGIGYKYDVCEELYQLVVSSFMSGDSFYEGKDERTQRLITLVSQVAQIKPEFIPALASYARTELHMRTTPTVLVAEALQRGIYGAERAAQHVWLRGDEHLEALAYVHATGNKRTKRFMEALRTRLNKLTQRQALRYACTGAGKAFSQKGAVLLAHTVPSNERQSALFCYLIKGWDELGEPVKALLPHIAAAKSGEKDAGWEQLISREGSTAKTWEKAIPDMGYMALLRNLRNFIEKEISLKSAELVVAKLTNPEEVARSKQLPFRFLSAYKVLNPNDISNKHWPARFGTHTGAQLPSKLAALFSKAVEKAMDLASVNVPEMPGRTLILVDVSGSMQSPVSAKSTILHSEAASVLGAIMAKRVNGGELWAFGTRSKPITVGASESLLSIAKRIPAMGDELDHGTEIEAAMNKALFNRKDGVRFDRMFVFTDMQTWSSGGERGYPYNRSAGVGTDALLAQYRKQVPTFHGYGVNMAGYSTSAFRKNGNGALTAEVGGWSEKIIQLALQNESNDPIGHILKMWNDSVPAGLSIEHQEEEEADEGATPVLLSTT